MSDDSKGIKELPEDVQALLDSAADIEPAPHQLSERIWDRLGSSIGGLGPLDVPGLDHPLPGGDATSSAADAVQSAVAQGASTAASTGAAATGAAATGAAATGAAATLSISKIAAAIWTASTFAVGTIAGAGTHAALTDPPQEPPLTQSVSSPTAPADAGVELVTADMGAPEVTQEVDMPEDAGEDRAALADLGVDSGDDAQGRAARQPVNTPPAKVSARSLEAERLLLARAQRALSRGDGKEALDVIGQHERRFGRDSSLAEERDFLRIRALLSTGARDRARTATSRFRKRYPGSIFLDALDKEERP